MEGQNGCLSFVDDRRNTYTSLRTLLFYGTDLESYRRHYRTLYGMDMNGYRKMAFRERSKARKTVSDAIELGLGCDGLLVAVAERYGLRGFVELKTTSFPPRERELLGRMINAHKEICAAAFGNSPAGRGNLSSMRRKMGEYVMDAVDMGMGDVEFVKEMAAEYRKKTYLLRNSWKDAWYEAGSG